MSFFSFRSAPRPTSPWLGLFSFALLLLLSACAKTPSPPEVPVQAESLRLAPLTTPGLFPVSGEEAQRLSRALSPSAQGLSSWRDMEFAVDQSLAHAKLTPPSQVALAGPTRNITYAELVSALTTFKEILPRLDAEPGLLTERFRWFRVGPDFGFTGYYEPELAASHTRTARFRYPLYKRPPELGRHSRSRPYHNRHAIDCKGVLRGRGLEIAWVEDPVDIFILQIQGSGRLRYADGTIRYALYAGQNGHKYVPLGRVLREKGLIDPDNITMDTIRASLAQHPDKQDELLDANPSYVFFRLADTPSLGSMGREITPWVSVATDKRVLPHGTLTFMSLELPSPQGPQPYHALTLPQDTGGAIRNNRVDLFCGAGERATNIAGELNTKGAVFLLLPKEML